MTAGFTNGCFDLFHPGHLHFLKRCRDNCDTLTLALDGDERVRRLKGPHRPMQEWMERWGAIRKTGLVHTVIHFDNDADLVTLVHRLMPDIMFKGSDYQNKSILGEEHAGCVMLFDLLPGYSTTEIIRRSMT